MYHEDFGFDAVTLAGPMDNDAPMEPADTLEQEFAAHLLGLVLASDLFAARNPGLAIGSPPTDDATGVLADVLGRCVARVQRLAAIADERGRAGQLCERAYDALTETDGK